MNRADATRWAEEWFSRFTDEDNVDEHGRYLYADWADTRPAGEPGIFAQASKDSSLPRTAYEHLRDLSENDLGEYLMYFSDFHLNLLSLSSPVVSERIRGALGDSPEMAARKREQMQRIVKVMHDKKR